MEIGWLGIRVAAVAALASVSQAATAAELRFRGRWGAPQIVLDGAVTELDVAAKAPVAVAVSAGRASLRVFEVPSRRLRVHLPQSYVVGDRAEAALSPDGRTLATTLDELPTTQRSEIRLFDTVDGRETGRIPAPSRTARWSALAISPDGRDLLAADEHLGLFAWDLASRRVLWHEAQRSNGRVTDLSFIGAGETAAVFEVASANPSPWVLDTRTGKRLRAFDQHTWRGATSLDGRWLLGLNMSTVDVFGADGRASRSLASGEADYGLLAAAFSADGARVVAGGKSGAVRVLDAASGALRQVFLGHYGAVTSVAVAPDGKTLLSGSEDNTVRLWDVAAGREVPAGFGHAGGVLAIARSSDGERVMTAGRDGEVRVYAPDGAPLEVVRATPPVLDRSRVFAAAFHVPTARVLTVDAQGVSCRDVRSGALAWQLPFAAALPVQLDVNARGEVLAALGTTLFLLDVRTGRQLRRLQKGWVATARFAPRGREILWSDGDRPLEILDVASGRAVKKLAGHRGPAFLGEGSGPSRFVQDAPLSAGALAMAPNQRMLASAREDDVMLWALPSGRLLAKLPRPYATHRALAFSPDGRWLVMANDQGRVELLDVARRLVVHGLDLAAGAGKTADLTVHTLAFVADGKRLLLGTRGGSLYELELLP